MRFRFALLTGKLLRLVGRFCGKATNLPGSVALKICPDLFRHFHFDGKILAVTGSNGKTTTANLIAHILKESGHSVINNAKGSNLLGGVATTLLTSSSFKGRVKQEFVVLEVDERFSRLIFRDFSPDMMLVTNLFRDQLTRNGNVDVIVSKLEEAIAPNVKLLLNANDPISSLLAPENPRVYYAMEKADASHDVCLNITHDAKVCPKCFARMKYRYYHYNHIGDYQCVGCGYRTPEASYLATDVSIETGDYQISGYPIHTEYRNLFYVLNSTGAAAACCELGIGMEQVAAGLNSFQVSQERYDEFTTNGRGGVMILSKNQNPVSFDQSISYVLEQPGEKTLVVYVNNINHTHNRDTTWLYDISFERLRDKVDSIICTGPRAYDLAVRLDLCGFPCRQIKIQPEVKSLNPVIQETKGTVYVLTELYDAKAILEVIAE